MKLSLLVSKSHEKVSFGDLWSVTLWFPKGRGLSSFVNRHKKFCISSLPTFTGFCFFVFLFYILVRNRFHVGVLLFSNRSQMTSKCGKNHTVTCATDVLTTFWRLLLQFRLRRGRRAFLQSRVSYDVDGAWLFHLINLSGDIDPNPDPCGECNRNVRSNQDAILCSECDR